MKQRIKIRERAREGECEEKRQICNYFVCKKKTNGAHSCVISVICFAEMVVGPIKFQRFSLGWHACQKSHGVAAWIRNVIVATPKKKEPTCCQNGILGGSDNSDGN